MIIKRSATEVNAVSASIASPRSIARIAYRIRVTTGAKSPKAFARSKAVSKLKRGLESSWAYRWHRIDHEQSNTPGSVYLVLPEVLDAVRNSLLHS